MSEILTFTHAMILNYLRLEKRRERYYKSSAKELEKSKEKLKDVNWQQLGLIFGGLFLFSIIIVLTISITSAIYLTKFVAYLSPIIFEFITNSFVTLFMVS